MSARWLLMQSIKSRRKRYEACDDVVRVTGVEPARLSAREPKSRMSANSIIPADILLNKNYMKLLLKKPIAGAIGFCGAAYEARTRYLHLGKVALYRMS